MDTLLRIAISNAVAATALALVAAAVSRVIRRPTLTHVLWVIVLLKLITPPIFALPVRLGTPRQSGGEVPPRAVDVREPLRALTSDRPRPKVVPIARLVWLVAVVAWGSGGVIVAGMAGARLRRFAMLLRYATTASADVQAQCRGLAAQLGVRRCPPVEFLPGRVGPMLWAPVLQPRLIIAVELWDRLSLRQRSSLLLHELAHLRRGDHWVRVLELLVLTLFWWHPVVWWARHALRDAEEQCCDAWVTWVLPDGNHDYACALVEAVDFASSATVRAALPALASGLGEFRHLKRRLIMIHQAPHKPVLGKVGILFAGAAAVLLPLTLSPAQQPPRSAPAGAAAPTTQPQIDPALLAQLRRHLPEMQFDNVGFSDVLDFMHDVSAVRIVVDWEALEAAGVGRNSLVKVDAKNVTFAEAMKEILDAVAKPGVLTWRPSGKILLVTATAEPKLVQRRYDVQDLVANGKSDALVKKILTAVAPYSWKDKGGDIGMINLRGGKLLVTQTEANQKEIADLLTQMRQQGKQEK